MNPSAVVLLSGGIDSGTMLALALKEKQNVLAVTFLYGQRHEKEASIAHHLAVHYGVPHQTIKLNSSLFEGSAITSGYPVPEGTYEEAQAGKEGPISTYVPFRNGNLISAAASIAVREGATSVYFAAHSDDSVRWAYPDCTPEFLGAMANAIYVGTDRKVRLRFPFVFMTKADIVELAIKLEVPAGLTWSCYKGESKHCGTCPTCNERIRAFKIAGYRDPVDYNIPIFWEDEKPWPKY